MSKSGERDGTGIGECETSSSKTPRLEQGYSEGSSFSDPTRELKCDVCKKSSKALIVVCENGHLNCPNEYIHMSNFTLCSYNSKETGICHGVLVFPSYNLLQSLNKLAAHDRLIPSQSKLSCRNPQPGGYSVKEVAIKVETHSQKLTPATVSNVSSSPKVEDCKPVGDIFAQWFGGPPPEGIKTESKNQSKVNTSNPCKSSEQLKGNESMTEQPEVKEYVFEKSTRQPKDNEYIFEKSLEKPKLNEDTSEKLSKEPTLKENTDEKSTGQPNFCAKISEESLEQPDVEDNMADESSEQPDLEESLVEKSSDQSNFSADISEESSEQSDLEENLVEISSKEPKHNEDLAENCSEQSCQRETETPPSQLYGNNTSTTSYKQRNPGIIAVPSSARLSITFDEAMAFLKNNSGRRAMESRVLSGEFSPKECSHESSMPEYQVSTFFKNHMNDLQNDENISKLPEWTKINKLL